MFEVLVASCGVKPGTKVGGTVGHEIEVCKLKPICEELALTAHTARKAKIFTLRPFPDVCKGKVWDERSCMSLCPSVPMGSKISLEGGRQGGEEMAGREWRQGDGSGHVGEYGSGKQFLKSLEIGKLWHEHSSELLLTWSSLRGRGGTRCPGHLQ